MIDKAIPAALSETRWEIIKQLGNCTKEGEAKINKDISEDLPPDIEPKTAMKEMDNMARQSDMLVKIKDTDKFGKITISYRLDAFGWRLYQHLGEIERRATRKHPNGRGPNKPKPDNIPKQESLDISPIHQSTVGVDAVMSAVDDLVKENASLRAGLISTMKTELQSLNKLRALLGFGPLVDSNKTEKENEK